MLSRFICILLFVTLWTLACQALLSMGFSRQEYWSGLPCPPPGNLPDPGIESLSLMFPEIAGGFFCLFVCFLPLSPPGKPPRSNLQIQCNSYQITDGSFHRLEQETITICMETQKTLNDQRNLKRHGSDGIRLPTSE